MNVRGPWPGKWRRKDLERLSADELVDLALELQADRDRQQLYAREHLCALGRMGVVLAGKELENEDLLREVNAYRTGERLATR